MTTTKAGTTTQRIQLLVNGIQAFHWSDGNITLIRQQQPVGTIYHLGNHDLQLQGVYRLVDAHGRELARGTQPHCLNAVTSDIAQ